MNRIMQWLSVLFIGIFATTVCTAGVRTDTPIGYWKTIDDVSGKPKSIIQIWKSDNNVLKGKVIKVFGKNGAVQDKICNACQGDYHDKPIVGMVIISGLKANQSQWGSGRILDPENGKTYSCSLRVAENGKKLNVHGYIGIPILGRSQIWERVDLMSSK